MMNRRRFVLLAPALVALAGLAGAAEKEGVEIAGKEAVATVTVTVYYGTNGDASAAGQRATEVPKEVEKHLQSVDTLKFAKYRQIGKDVKPLFRSYENWAQPFSGSDEILLRFEAQSQLVKDTVRLDLELWRTNKKLLKTIAPVVLSKPLLVLGPEWRGGRLILAIELAPVPAAK